MGGAKAEFRVKSFLGTLGTKIFHANADIETNTYASSLIGEALFESKSVGNSIGQSQSRTETVSEVYQKMVRPEDFIRLRTGSASCNHIVDGVFAQ